MNTEINENEHKKIIALLGILNTLYKFIYNHHQSVLPKAGLSLQTQESR